VSSRQPGLDAARQYDRWFETAWGKYAFVVEQGALQMALGPVAGVFLLDAGCGPGRFAQRLQKGGADVVCIDVDAAMVALARQRMSAPAVQGDVGRLPFHSEIFDAVVAVTLLEFVERPERVVSELVRVTRAGGKLVIAALNRTSPWGVAHRKRLRRPPWDRAHFLTRSTLLSLGRRHGDARLAGALHAPGPIPGLRLVGPVLEEIGRLAPRLGAFQVLVVTRS